MRTEESETMSGDLIHNMRGRAEKCRRLARSVLDDQAGQALLKMAAEIEADIDRLVAAGEGANGAVGAARAALSDHQSRQCQKQVRGQGARGLPGRG